MTAPQPKRGRTLDAMFVLALLVLVGVGAYAATPYVVKSTLASRAAAEGLTLTIADVKVGLHELRLRQVELRAADLPGVTLTASSVDVGLKELQIEALTANDAELRIDGSLPSVVENVEHFRTRHPLDLDPPLHMLSAEDMRLRWTRVAGERTTLVADNVHIEIERHESRAIGDDVAVSLPIVKLETPVGRFGPWSATLQRDPENLHGRVVLEPTGAAIVQGTLGTDGTGQIQLDTPPIPLASLGVPQAALAALKIGGTARWAVPAKDKIDAKVDLTFSGLRLAGAAQPADVVHVEGETSGDARRTLPIQNGAITFGAVRAPASGTIDVAGGGVKLDVAFKSAPRPCETPAPDREQIAGQIVVDTRRLDEIAAWAGSLGRCPVRFLPARGAP